MKRTATTGLCSETQNPIFISAAQQYAVAHGEVILLVKVAACRKLPKLRRTEVNMTISLEKRGQVRTLFRYDLPTPGSQSVPWALMGAGRRVRCNYRVYDTCGNFHAKGGSW